MIKKLNLEFMPGPLKLWNDPEVVRQIYSQQNLIIDVLNSLTPEKEEEVDNQFSKPEVSIKGDRENEFESTKFATGGGLAFECSDHEGMYVELKSFIHKAIAQSLQSERDRIRKGVLHLDKTVVQGTRDGYHAGFNDARYHTLKLLDNPTEK